MIDMGNVSNYDAGIFEKMSLFVKENYHRSIYISDIAAAGAVCKSKCNLIFQKVIQKTPNEYLNEIRLENCRKLLEDSDFSLSEIALKCGFSDQSYFCRNFYKKFSLSPRVYRKSFEYKNSKRSPLDLGSMDFALETFCSKYTDVAKVNVLTGEVCILKNTTSIENKFTDFYSYIKSTENLSQIYFKDVNSYLDFFMSKGSVVDVLSKKWAKEINFEYRRKIDGIYYWAKAGIIIPGFYSLDRPYVLVTRNIEGLCPENVGLNNFYIPYFQKVLQADLHHDTYSIVKVHKDELPFSALSMTSLSGWIEEFSKSNIIFEDDRNPFIANVNVSRIRNYFNSADFSSNEEKSYCVKYRRLINGKYKWAKLEIIPSAEFSYFKQEVFLSIRQIEY